VALKERKHAVFPGQQKEELPVDDPRGKRSEPLGFRGIE
jgi:hypothetical protein